MNFKFLVVCFFAFTAMTVFSKDMVTSNFSCLITPNSIAGVKIGMKASEIKKIFPNAKFERFEDGEGVVGVSVISNGKELLNFYTGEEQDTPIDLTRKIGALMTCDVSCRTKDGIGNGVLVKHAARKLGGIVEIITSEIESREYVTFRNQNKTISYRMDGTGIYKGTSSTTKNYPTNAKIIAVEIGE